MTQIIDGKAIALEFRKKIKDAVAILQDEHSFQAGLAVILVGEDPASEVYVRNKGIATQNAGMKSLEYRLNKNTSEKELIDLIHTLNHDDSIDGILVQSPVPSQINYQAIVETIDPAKDVDGFHPVNAGNLLIGTDSLVACTPLGCSILLKTVHGDNLSGKNAVVIGRSTIVGKPMAMLLLQQNCTVTIAHSHTNNISEICSNADIIVAAVGQPKMVKADWVKPGATIIDVGINRIGTADSGKAILIGDADFDEVSKIAGAITPVPGGVGPMTIACLLYNTLKAACLRREINIPDIFSEFI